MPESSTQVLLPAVQPQRPATPRRRPATLCYPDQELPEAAPQQLSPQVIELIERLGVLRRDGSQVLPVASFVINVYEGDVTYVTQKTKRVKKMKKTDSSVKANGGIVGHVTTGKKNKVSGDISVNHASTAAPELNERIQKLEEIIGQLADSLEPKDASKVRRDLSALKEEVTSEAPRKEWYQLSAKGLIDAAKTLGNMAKPVGDAVKAVLDIVSPA